MPDPLHAQQDDDATRTMAAKEHPVSFSDKGNGQWVMKFLDSQIVGSEKIAEIQNELDIFLSQRRPKKLVMDFSEVEQMSTAAFSLLLEAKNRVAVANGQLVLAEVDAKIFQITHLDKVFDIETTVQEALASAGRDGAAR